MHGDKMNFIEFILNPSGELTLVSIIAISFILGILHGITPDEHTWPITFSYAIGKYSTKGGLLAGLLFSLGFTIQRALLTTIGYLGLARIYQVYNLDGPVYIAVGIVMAIAGSYVLHGKYVHIHLIPSHRHTEKAERVEMPKDVPLKMTIIHGLIAGFGFGAYASIITFVLAPKVPSLIYSPLPGLFFGLGTMTMQIILGAFFGGIMRKMGYNENDIKFVGTKTAGNTLYYGGIAFALIGLLVVMMPSIDNFAISTGIQIPNLNAIDIGFILVIFVVGAIGIGSLVKTVYELRKGKLNVINRK
ncbi:hypothetical protein Calag_0710 [Caldisphaera lagunensis DSM 15908]|uniref:Urease accessory protein UreH-like transmembrane domain-containing protein n=2 Tax=Caldisphaera lagunensis TaxID=200415 RepID=L0ABN2_CALLD|nr:hypothetical protein Calag_0710 [Caldisphaera lagunensis DSM 15908]